MKREGYRETYSPSATAWWEGTQTVLKDAQGARGASTRAATWDITALDRAENFLFLGKWNTETEVLRVCWAFTLGGAQVSCAWPWATWSDGIGSAGWTRWPLQAHSNLYYTLISSCYSYFSGAKNQVFICLALSSAADDPGIEDRVINKYMFKFITIYIHLFPFFHARKTGIFVSQYVLLFCFLHLLVIYTQNRMTWENQENMRKTTRTR